MKIPKAFGDAAPHATVAEVERLNWLEKRVKTLEGWIKERDALREEYQQLVAAVKARMPQTESSGTA